MRPQKVEITEVGARDGLQSERAFVPTHDKIAFIEGFIGAGVRRIEATSFVSPRAVPQLADAAEVVAAVKGRGARIAALAPNARGAEHAIVAGVDEIVVFVSASESHSLANLNASVERALEMAAEVASVMAGSGKVLRAAIATAFGCPFEGDVLPARVSEIAARLKALGVGALTLGDTTGMAAPPHVEALCRRLALDHPDIELTLHFHNTRGFGLVNVMAGLDMGITRFESSCGGLGGCPFAPGATGNVCTEDLVYLMDELGVETGIDLAALVETAKMMEACLGRTLPGQVMRAGTRACLHPLDAVRRARG